MSKKDWNVEEVINWMSLEGRLIPDPKAFLEATVRRIVDAGAPLWRMRLGCRTIHPQIAAWSVIWSTDMPRAVEHNADHGFREHDEYIGSPVAHVVDTGTLFRKKLVGLVEDRDHRLLFELAADGATDYLALPVKFSVGPDSYMTAVSNREGGFDDVDIAKLTRLVSFIAPIFEVFATRRIAATLLNTYVGRRTGERVLSGQVRRGDGEIIHAVIWFSDLREFTLLTESLPPKDLLALLNTYFELVSAAVTARGGEVLRFIGDAMLIVFPVSKSITVDVACVAAVDAAADAFASMATVNMRRARSGLPEIRFGVGLHKGDVIYGNVGAPDRLDFTVMGPAVNRTARLESLTKKVGRPLLMSADVAKVIPIKSTSLGFHEMRGIIEPQEVFAPDFDDE